MLDKNEWIRPWAGSDDEVTKMLDIKLIRENPDKIKAGLKAKEVDCDELIDRILELDEQRRTLLQQTEALKAADRNPYSWNMDLYEYPDGSGYEARFTCCGICALMKKLGLYDLTPAMWASRSMTARRCSSRS